MEDRKTFERICNQLRNHSYKITPQRQTILHMFVEHADRHLSADDVYTLVQDQNPEIGLATVYRTLDMLEEIGVLSKNDFGDGRTRYEFSRKNEHHHHHHLICLKCGYVSEFDDDLLESLEAVITDRNHFRVVDHDLKFYGYCSQCGGV